MTPTVNKKTCDEGPYRADHNKTNHPKLADSGLITLKRRRYLGCAWGDTFAIN